MMIQILGISYVWIERSLENNPIYSKLDLHLSYKLPEIGGLDMTLHGHVFTLIMYMFKTLTDNSKYNGYGDKLHLTFNFLKYFWVHQDTTT